MKGSVIMEESSENSLVSDMNDEEDLSVKDGYARDQTLNFSV
jgi:hypothetical protein